MRPKKQPSKLSYGSAVTSSVTSHSSRSRISRGSAGAVTSSRSSSGGGGIVRRRQRRHRGSVSSCRQAVGREDSDREGGDDEREDGEGTEDASEAGSEDSDGQDDQEQERVTEIKERMYLDKLANLKSQLSQLKQGIHPEYVQRLEQIEQRYKDRVHFADVWLEYECQLIDAECQRDQLLLQTELEQRRLELREQLIAELEDKRRQADAECSNMDINGDTADVKQIPTRKLRRRPNDPAPVQDKRRKCGGVTAPVFLLEDTQIDEDLLNISRNRPPPPQPPQQQQTSYRKSSYLPDFNVTSSLSSTSLSLSSSTAPTTAPLSSSCPPAAAASSPAAVTAGAMSASSSLLANDVRIEDNKLFFERKWFHRGQPVFVEMSQRQSTVDEASAAYTSQASSSCNYSAVITAIQSDVVWVRKTSDNTKARISLDQLQSNACSIKRRAS